MCLVACYWARVPRVVFGATSYDVATYGFEDLQFYRELSRSADQRSLQEDAAEDESRQDAGAVLRAWAEQLPFEVEPKVLMCGHGGGMRSGEVLVPKRSVGAGCVGNAA